MGATMITTALGECPYCEGDGEIVVDPEVFVCRRCLGIEFPSPPPGVPGGIAPWACAHSASASRASAGIRMVCTTMAEPMRRARLQVPRIFTSNGEMNNG